MIQNPEVVVDARGMRCPWPALRLARAMRQAVTATLISDDPQAKAEVATLAQQHGWTIATDCSDAGVARITATRAA